VSNDYFIWEGLQEGRYSSKFCAVPLSAEKVRAVDVDGPMSGVSDQPCDIAAARIEQTKFGDTLQLVVIFPRTAMAGRGRNVLAQ
jgi:hypothetical protein